MNTYLIRYRNKQGQADNGFVSANSFSEANVVAVYRFGLGIIQVVKV